MVKTICWTLCLAALSGCTLLDSQSLVSRADSSVAQESTVSPAAAAAVPAGAEVEVMHSANDSCTMTTGTVLKASTDGVALMNCHVRSSHMTGTPVLSKTPWVSRWFKNTGVGQERVPVVWVPVSRMSTLRILQAPPAGYVSSALAIDMTSGPEEIERTGIDIDYAALDSGR
jgi:hypothetical protein